MFDAAPSMDSMFLPLKEISQQVNNPLRKPMRAFLTKVNTLLGSRKNLPEHSATLRDEQFALRLRTVAWLVKEKIDLAKAMKEVDEQLRSAAGHATLVANMRFALNTQLDVLRSIFPADPDSIGMDGTALEHLGNIQFPQFESALLMGVPNPQAAQLLLGWMHASMDMEIGLLMGDAVLDDEVRITPNRMDALNSFLVHASQTYGASARLLGIVRASHGVPIAAEPLPASWLKGQKRLADEGLGDWLRL